MRLVLPLPPSANRYWRTGKGRTYVSREARAYKELAYFTALQQGARPLDGDVILRGTIYFPNRRGDLSNRVKIVEDSLQNACYHNDSQVVRIDFSRAIDKADPRVELDITEAT